MIEQIYNFFTIEMLYFWINLGVLPFWFLIVFFPQSNLCKYLATSIFPIFLLSAAYCFVLYKSFLNSYNFLDNFHLYLGLDFVANLFENSLFILLFWIHFVSINLFVGGWILKDSQNFLINKFIVAIPLITTYLIGPLGLFVYWIIRIFFAKRMSLYD
tara:strand:+ start:760 stop:1233 length:474 start_codon:yes stop_codon:yes gene_type:complete